MDKRRILDRLAGGTDPNGNVYRAFNLYKPALLAPSPGLALAAGLGTGWAPVAGRLVGLRPAIPPGWALVVGRLGGGVTDIDLVYIDRGSGRGGSCDFAYRQHDNFRPSPIQTDGEAANPGPSRRRRRLGWKHLPNIRLIQINATSGKKHLSELLGWPADIIACQEVRVPTPGQSAVENECSGLGWAPVWGKLRSELNEPGGVANFHKAEHRAEATVFAD